METTSFWQSNAFVALIGMVTALIAVWIGAKLQRGQGREVERDRFRHDVASQTAEERLKAYVELAKKVALAYRTKVNAQSGAQTALDEAKNFYYDNRFFFSNTAGSAFREAEESLSLPTPSRDILTKNLNDFYNTVREDLLLRDLAESVQRAVIAKKASQKSPGTA